MGRVWQFWLLAAWAMAAVPASGAAPDELAFFETQVRPLLAERCQTCHGEKQQKGGLRLDSLPHMLAGGESGPALEPGQPDSSLMIEAVNYASYEMPPSGKLSEDEIGVLTRWVAMGAPWPGAETGQVVVRQEKGFTDEDRAFWAFQPLADVEPPEVADDGWCRNEVDQFVLHRLREAGLHPAAEADRATLIRRLYFDLHGLPPTPEEVAAFVSDPSPEAYETLVDRLLKSPAYGERWARHWLDLVRYAESDGFKQDAYRPHAWRYRDYVIQSLNDDKPYDRFVMEQLAGDEIAPQDSEMLAATGYLRHWIYEYNQRDVRTQWSNILNDVTDVTSDVFLGLGMACARCHDHKFDPILQEDYYRLQAFFTPLLPRDDIPFLDGRQLAEYEAAMNEWEEATRQIRAELAEIEAPHRRRVADAAINKFPPDVRPLLRKDPAEREPLEAQLADLAFRQVLGEYEKLDFNKLLKGEQLERWKQLQAELDAIERPPTPPQAFTVRDVGPDAPPTLISGRRTATEVAPGFLTILDPAEAEILEPPGTTQSTGRRYTLARWLTSPDNPLSTRVIVNRVWQHHFGRGLVGTPSNFGRLGEAPTHPELLDWLAARFVQQGWRLKELHRLLVTSATYRQASAVQSDAAMRIDPENRLLWRMSPRRLQAEQIRDATLAVSGELDLTAGGPSAAHDEPRRTIYTQVIRNSRDPLLEVFDSPDGFCSMPERNVTTTATQALLMMNGDWTGERAEAFARRLTQNEELTEREQVARAFWLAFGRPPREDETNLAIQFLAQQRMSASRNQAAGGDPVKPLPRTERMAWSFRPAQQEPPLRAEARLELDSPAWTVEAIVMLRSLYEDATVRTIVSQWDSQQQHAGWSLGVTSTKSRFQPRNLILQLVGPAADGSTQYEVVASDLRLELNKPYHVAARVQLGHEGKPGTVDFVVHDLSIEPHIRQAASREHPILHPLRTDSRLTIGGRDGADRHCWDGLIAAVRLTAADVPEGELLVKKPRADAPRLLDWGPDQTTQQFADRGAHQVVLRPQHGGASPASDPALSAWIDFCHVLLNANEFLYAP